MWSKTQNNFAALMLRDNWRAFPTGDGMSLVFFDDPQAPLECATQIASALKSHPDIRLRMGIHSGPVNEVSDLNG